MRERCKLAEEAEFAGREGGAQLIEEQAAEEPREDAHRQEEPPATGNPARVVERGTAAGHDTVDMRMVVQVLAPGMEHRDEAGLDAEMLRVGRDRPQRLSRRSEQDGVDRCLVVEGDLGHRRRQGEYDVEVRHRQQLGLTGGKPLGACLPLALRAMPVAAGVVGAADEAAIGAGLGMAAQHRCPAQLDGAHYPPLDAAQVSVMGAAIRFAVAAKDIRHFQIGRHDAAGSGGRHDL